MGRGPYSTTLSINDVVQGEYTVYVQIKRPDGARCGFTRTVTIEKGDSCSSITEAKNLLRRAIGVITQSARGKAPEILTANQKRVKD